jgi:hypothetical protein
LTRQVPVAVVRCSPTKAVDEALATFFEGMDVAGYRGRDVVDRVWLWVVLPTVALAGVDRGGPGA